MLRGFGECLEKVPRGRFCMLNRSNYNRNGHVWNPVPDIELESLRGVHIFGWGFAKRGVCPNPLVTGLIYSRLLLRSEEALRPLYVYSVFARWHQLATDKLITIQSPDGRTLHYARRGALRCETVHCDAMTSGFVSDLFTSSRSSRTRLLSSGVRAKQMENASVLTTVSRIILSADFRR